MFVVDLIQEHKIISGGLTAILLLCWGVKRLFAPPANIAHVPAVSVIQYCYSIFSAEGFDDRAERLVAPLLNKHGCARLWLGQWFVVISEPEKVQHILTNPEIYIKLKTAEYDPNSLATRFLGPNLAEVDGQTWRRHRKVANPAFRRGWTTDIFGKCAIRMVNMLKPGVPIEMNSLLRGITLDSLGFSIFGFDFKALEQPPGPYPTIYNDIIKAVSNPLFGIFTRLERLPFPSRIKARNQIDEFRNLLGELIEKRRDEIRYNKSTFDSTHSDLVTLMVQASEIQEDSDEPLLTDDEIINDAVLFFFAGHDTTANTLVFAMYYLCVHPHMQEEARNEVNSILLREGDMKPMVPSFEHQSKMAYLQAVIYESVRIAPVAIMLGRVLACRVTDLLDFPLEEGNSVLVHLGLSMKDPSVWENPLEFNPERFLIRTDAGWIFNKASLKYMVGFGQGPRMCMGLQFTLIEQRVLLSMILQSYSFKLPPNSPHSKRPKMSAFGVPTLKDLEIIFTPC